MFFPIEKTAKQLEELRLAIYREIHPIPQWKYFVGACPDAHLPDFDDHAWADFRLGDAWGGYDVIAWFRATITIPAHLRDQKLALRFLVGPLDSGNSTAESLVYVNGAPLQSVDRWHDEVWLPPEAKENGTLQIAIKAWSGVLDIPPHRHFRLAQLLWIDEPTERLYWTAHTVLRAVQQLDPNDLRRVELLRIVDQAIRQVEFVQHRPEQFYVLTERAMADTATPVRWAGTHANLLYDSTAQSADWLDAQLTALKSDRRSTPTVIGVGHAHIDMAWLWRLSHIQEKAVRTFTTALHLMRQYPDYHFLHTSPQLYKFLQTDEPALFARIKEMIQAGRWEASGGMWVEADTNLPNGESLVRQIVWGKRYFREEFGVDNHVLWLPDVFGYSWCLPQLMRKSGMPYFLTSKLSWSQYNRMPYDTFTWRGIDGSEVLAYFITTPEQGSPYYTYNGLMTPFDVKGTWDQYRQKAINDELMLLYGWGDGGGGPTRGMLEAAKVLEDLPGMPRVELGPAEPFFDRLAERLKDQPVPVWDGEMYLEYHRGTYTSQAYNKRANRKAEWLYHDAEWLSTLADLLVQQAYPVAAFRAGWELLLLNQFHDILPGSSIHDVYQDSRKQYAEIERIGQAVVAEAQGALLSALAVEQASVIVLNPLGWTRDGLIQCPYDQGLAGQTIVQPNGTRSPVQVVTTEGQPQVLLHVEDVPAFGYRSFPLAAQGEPDDVGETLVIQPTYLENRWWEITLNTSGQIVSIFDKTNMREVLAGVGNVFQVFQDKPMAFDAWDIDIYYQEKMQLIETLVEATVEETGPLRGVLRLRWQFYDSTITQYLTLYAHSPRIDFRTEVDWHEQQRLLKVAFPIAVRTTRATYDIQWGNIERPTHWNTSWDWARFESVGHKWVDLSEGNYGVALLNDCKYGHDIKHNVMRLTLIKSPIRPDPLADQGLHHFTYSLLPHAGDWRASAVVQSAYDLNDPLRVGLVPAQPSGTLPPVYGFAAVDAEHVIIETIKQAEDGDGWIVRLYEYKQYHNQAVTLTFGQPIMRAVECNLLEEEEQVAHVEGDRLHFAITPYEIKTYRVWFGR